MARAAGWSVLAEKALEISALALACRVMEPGPAVLAVAPVPAQDPEPPTPEEPIAVQEPATPAPAVTPQAFIDEGRDVSTRVYRAADREGEMIAAFYADGRVRLADERFRFAGMVQNAHAHLLDVGSEDWSELFVRVAPSGALQLELRDGPYDARILTCTPA